MMKTAAISSVQLPSLTLALRCNNKGAKSFFITTSYYVSILNNCTKSFYYNA